jgi:hypothetical protein
MRPPFSFMKRGTQAPTVSSVTPAFSTTAGGVSITITGTNFVNGATVKAGVTSCTSVVFNSSTSITCTLPAKAFGQYDLSVTNPDTQVGTLTNGVAYYAEIDFTSLTPGSYVNATFLTATGLTSFTRADTTTTNQATVRKSETQLTSGIAANLPRAYFDGTYSGFLIEQKVQNFAPNPHNITTSWTASAQGTQTGGAVTGPDGTVTQASRIQLTATSQISNYYDLGSDSAVRWNMSVWQRSQSAFAGLGDMQQTSINFANSNSVPTTRSATDSWGRMSTAKGTTALRYWIPADSYDRSGQGGQTAKTRDVDVDFMHIERGDFATSAIGATTTRPQDRPKWTFSTSGNRIRMHARFRPLFASSVQVWAATTALTLWPIYYIDASNLATVADSDKKVTVTVAGSALTTTNAMSWAAYDQVDVLIEVGNGVASVCKYSVNGGAWTDLILGTFSGNATPSADMSLFTGATSDDNTLPCLVQKVRAYPVDVLTTDLGLLAPTVSSISLDLGDTAGGTSVTITGSGFSSGGATSAAIGGTNLTSFVVVNNTTITGVTAAHVAATGQSVTVTGPGGTGVLTNAFEYFNPTSITGCIWWLRADLGVTLNSGNVSAWADQSGRADSNRNANQATTGDQPPFNSTDASYNNKPTIGVFSSGTRKLINPGAWSASYTPYTMCVVGHTQNSGNKYFTYGDGTHYGALLASGDFARLYGGNATNSVLAGSGSTSTAPCFIKGEWNGASSKVYVNATNTVTQSGTLDADSLGAVAMNVGSYPTSGATFGVEKIAELFAWNKVLSSAENTRLRKYINDRYAKSMTL